MTTFSISRMAIVDEVIKLAKDRRETYENSSIGEDSITSIAFRKLNETEEDKLNRAKAAKLREYLESLTFENIKFVQTLMYIGRDESVEEDISAERLYTEKYNALRWETKEIEINMIVEKLPLDIYLMNGKEIIKSLA